MKNIEPQQWKLCKRVIISVIMEVAHMNLAVSCFDMFIAGSPKRVISDVFACMYTGYMLLWIKDLNCLKCFLDAR